MKQIKSERLKKLEMELGDLEQWLKLGLVPKKDVEKHKEEIQGVKNKIQEEKERLDFLRDSGESEEYVTPKRNPTRTGFTDMPTLPDIDGGDSTVAAGADSSADTDNEGSDFGSSIIEEQGDNGDTVKEDTDEESYFSDRNRWRRGGIIDPDADEW